MAMTFAVFVVYGLFAAAVRDRVITRPKVMTWLRRSFAAGFAALGARLALAERLTLGCMRFKTKKADLRPAVLAKLTRKLGARAELSAPPGPKFTSSSTSWPSSPSPFSPSSLS